MWSGRGEKGSKECAVWGLPGDCWGKTLGCSRDFGAVSRPVHHPLPLMVCPPFPSLPQHLLLSLLPWEGLLGWDSGTAFSLPSSWTVHGPQPVQHMLVLAEPNWLLCLMVQLSIKRHPCTLILTAASSSSPLHPHPHPCIPHTAPQFSPIAQGHPWHCPDHLVLVLMLTLLKCLMWLSPEA